MSKITYLKETDEEKIKEGIAIVQEIFDAHPHIESCLWHEVILQTLVNGYIYGGSSRADFKEHMFAAIEHFQYWIEEDRVYKP